jgi:hypothetical protein
MLKAPMLFISFSDRGLAPDDPSGRGGKVNSRARSLPGHLFYNGLLDLRAEAFEIAALGFAAQGNLRGSSGS